MTPLGIEALLFPHLITVIIGLIATLGGVIAWVGIGIKSEINALHRTMAHTNDTLVNIERDLRGKLADMDRRVAIVERTCMVQHGKLEP